jgi:hypothetical protein
MKRHRFTMENRERLKVPNSHKYHKPTRNDQPIVECPRSATRMPLIEKKRDRRRLIQ